MDNYPRGRATDYQPIVDAAIRQAFEDHLDLFTLDGQDPPVLDELFNLKD